MSTTWEHVAADKRARIDKSIPSEWKISAPPSLTSVIDVPASSGILSEQELKITESTASELVPRLAKGQLKAVDVTLAFCKRAALAHQLVGFTLLVSAKMDRYIFFFLLTAKKRPTARWKSSPKLHWPKPRS